MTDQETLDAIGRAQNSLLEEGECVHHHACPCLQQELDRLRAIEKAAAEFLTWSTRRLVRKLDRRACPPGQQATVGGSVDPQ